MPTVFYAGDSTVQYNDISTYPQTGIGQVLPLFLKREVRVENYARNGRSTKSFIDESRMVPIYDRITEGDFLLVQFGHNDEKKEDTSRYTEAFGDFQVNLEKFVNVARNKGAHPVLITPLERRHFTEDGQLRPCSHGEYPRAVLELGARLGVPVIDLTALSRKALTEAGPEETKGWYMHLPAGKYEAHPEGKEDDTHLQYAGAVIYADLIARELEKLGGIYADLLCSREQDKEAFFVGGVM